MSGAGDQRDDLCVCGHTPAEHGPWRLHSKTYGCCSCDCYRPAVARPDQDTDDGERLTEAPERRPS